MPALLTKVQGQAGGAFESADEASRYASGAGWMSVSTPQPSRQRRWIQETRNRVRLGHVTKGGEFQFGPRQIFMEDDAGHELREKRAGKASPRFDVAGKMDAGKKAVVADLPSAGDEAVLEIRHHLGEDEGVEP